MANWALTHKKTGEIQFVKSLGGIDEDMWDATPITREPTEHDIFEEGKLVRRKREKHINDMTNIEIYNHILDKLHEEGIVDKNQLAKLKKPV